MEEYIYIGEHYDVLNRGIIINDKKIGLSDTPPRREKELTRTKSPVKYRIIEVYKVDDMKRVENLLHAILDSRRVDGEWFRDDDDTLVVILNCAGILCFKGGEYDTPNKLYNNGIVKYVTGKKGGSGTNQMTQFTLKTTGERLSEPVVD